MCCFSGPVEDVSDTKIFARLAGARQYLAYEMRFSAAADLAMVLPIPVVPGTGDDGVEFLSLEHYPDFFDDLFELVPQEILFDGDFMDGTLAPNGSLHGGSD